MSIRHLYFVFGEVSSQVFFPILNWLSVFLVFSCMRWLYSLCCTLHPSDYFVTTNWYFLILLPFSLSPQLPSLLATIILISVIYKSVCNFFVHLFCYLNSAYKWNHICLFLPDLFHIAYYPLGPSMVLQVFILVYGWVIVHCVCVPSHFIHS